MLADRPHWHTLTTDAVAARLRVDPAQGLASDEAARRLAQTHPNEITEQRRRSLLMLFVSQFTDFMILVLIAAAIIAGIVGEPQDSIAIGVILLLNAAIGFIQAYRAERAMAALLRIGWRIKRQSGTSHRILQRHGWPDILFAYHDRVTLGPSAMRVLANKTGLTPNNL